jgi:glucose 1-dehydrogenase
MPMTELAATGLDTTGSAASPAPEPSAPEPSASEPASPSLPAQRILVGQRALVTGANSGIGRAVAIALGQAGADVVVNYVDGVEAADAVVDEIRRSGVDSIAYQADVSSEEQVGAMFERMVQQFGTIDILVNNAGLQRDAAFHEMTLAQWNTVLQVNLTGQFLCARAAIREFLRRGVVPSVSCAAGKIICMSSVHQQIPWAGRANYAASKGGIKLLMESLAQEVAPHRIRVNAIAPGAIRTPINMAAWETQEAYDKLMKLVPYDRIGEPEDIARAAVWLASDHSDYVVGTTLFVDGGMTLYPGFATGG